jgi:putative thioredoxin
MIKRDKNWNEQAARKQLLKVLDTLGPDSEIARQGRKRLSSVWFM